MPDEIMKYLPLNPSEINEEIVKNLKLVPQKVEKKNDYAEVRKSEVPKPQDHGVIETKSI